MNANDARQLFSDHQMEVREETRLANNTGTQFRLVNGAVVNVFDTGTFNVQGKNQVEVQNALRAADSSPAKISVPLKTITNTPIDRHHVFIVYGHDQACRTQLEAMVRRWKLEPLILDQLPTQGQTIIEKLEKALEIAHFGIVLATPDDEGFRADRPDEKAFRARQNVVLEMGMLLTKLGRQNVAILLKTQENMERPSDIQGLIYIPFKDDVKEAGLPLAKAMDAQGYRIDLKNL